MLWHRLGTAIGGALMVGGVWWVDRATGAEMAFSVFYFLPVTFTTWFGGSGLGIAAAFASAAAWCAADVATRSYSTPSIYVWNTGVRLGVFLTVALLLARLRQARDAERALALSDPLTGSANSRAFYPRLELEIARCRRTGRPFGLVYFDLDGFKLVNDRHGHLVGDRVLKSVVRRAVDAMRDTDLVARLGGDEFAVLLADTGESGVARAADKLK